MLTSILRSVTLMSILAVAAPARAAAADAPAKPAAKAVQEAYMTFCIPAVLAPPAEAQKLAERAGYTKTDLPAFAPLKERTSPAWLVPSATGRVVVSRGGSGVAGAETCEITVRDTDSAPLRQAMEEATVCKGCPFVRNAAFPAQSAGMGIDKYDWQVNPKLMVSVLAVSLPDSSRGASFFVQTHALSAP